MRTGNISALMRPFLVVLAMFILPGIGVGARADTLRLSLPNGKSVNADHRSGDARLPAVVVLHGFLQTNEFLATQNIINGLSAQGYTILGPNLSLGVPNRQGSMQCQAAHQHTFEDDVSEVDFWVEWLRKQGHPSVILVGHSWGSQIGLGYTLAHPRAPVAAVITISLVRNSQDAKLRARQIAEAEARAGRRDISLQPYALSYCKTFMANPNSYLSYARWDDDRVFRTLERLQARKLPVYAVLGSRDKRIHHNWINELRRRVTHVTVVEGANHFFSSIYEFELIDRLLPILSDLTAKARR